MNTHEKAEKLIEQLQHNAEDYRNGNEASKYTLASLMNELVQLWREEEGFTPFDGKVKDERTSR